MYVLPKEFLCELICSCCKKYLSIPPIKVYPNRQVKCGRCCNVDDGGTKSSLFEMIIQSLKFPCINHMEGCKQYLPISEMRTHENACLKTTYYCPACLTFEGSSYEMSLHIRMEHKELMLEDKFFLIILDSSVDEKPTTNTYFYCDNELLVFIVVKYELDMLCFELRAARGNNNEVIGQKYSLFSTVNKLLYETEVADCSEWGATNMENVLIDISSLKIFNRAVMCKFDVVPTAAILLPFDQHPKLANSSVLCNMPNILDSSVSSALLRCKFQGMEKLRRYERVYSSVTYYVMDTPWKVFIKITLEDDNIYYLGCYVKKLENNFKCYVTYTFRLLSKFKRRNICQSSGNKVEYGLESAWGLSRVAKWDLISSSKNGYIENDSIEIEVEFNVEPMVEPKGKCTFCKSACFTCSQVNSTK